MANFIIELSYRPNSNLIFLFSPFEKHVIIRKLKHSKEIFYTMMNMQNMMRQAQKLQKQMEKSQAELAATQFTGSSVQDLVTATFTGDKKLVSIDFKSEVVDADDIETLQEMTVQAINDALTKVDEATQKKLGAFAGKLPF